MSMILSDELKTELKKVKTQEDLFGKNGLVKMMIKTMVEHIMEAELTEELGYEKYGSSKGLSGNSRNGHSRKTVRSSAGDIALETPRDRRGDYDPHIVKKHQKDISLFDDKIISMYAKGMTTRDIQDHLDDLYGVELSPATISNITDRVLERAKEWQSRPLDAVYAAVFFDAIHYKVRANGKIELKAAYTCLGITLEGKKEILGLWIGESEGAKFWLSVSNELKNRGVKDILIACIDGLKGLPDAIQTVFPKVEIQLCIIHMIRNSLKFVAHKYSREFVADLKNIYRAPSEKAAQSQLEILIEKWDSKYPLAVKPWIANWENLVTFFKFPDELRKLIYTTNAVESLHRQFRKVTKNRAVFPTDDALLKLLFLSAQDVSKKWTMPIHSWKILVSQLAIFFEGRVPF